MFSLLESSFIDYPGKICAVIFFPGCNFRCPFCHNPGLAKDDGSCIQNIQDIIKHLEKRKNVLDGVCLTGGEPLLHSENLLHLITAIKSITRKDNTTYLIKLDTNGYFPQKLKKLIDKKLIDYIAMDIKSSPAKYPKATAIDNIDINKINESIKLIRESNIAYEFRTTVVPDFFTEKDAILIGEWLKGSNKYVMQQFSNKQDMLDPVFQTKQPYPKDQLIEYQNLLKPYFENIKVRSI
ncbi:anaerobic ribonucleoside-triphosphate reductase activating protein [Candidatus Margulisiibacteriota bacterium]